MQLLLVLAVEYNYSLYISFTSTVGITVNKIPAIHRRLHQRKLLTRRDTSAGLIEIQPTSLSVDYRPSEVLAVPRLVLARLFKRLPVDS